MTFKWQDLGELGPKLLIYGGPYSNLQATEALMAEAEATGIPVRDRICTGDVVAYAGNPVETVALVRAQGGTVIAGNCERQLAEGQADCGCGFEEGSACDLASVAWFGFAAQALSQDDKDWMQDLPDGVTFTQSGRRFAVIHGGAQQNNRFIWPTDPDAVFAAEIARIQEAVGPVDAVLAGHCGLAFHRHVQGVDWINAGVIGMPPHDGRPHTRFLLLEQGHPVIRRLECDSSAAQQAMLSRGLTQGYHIAVVSGLWPSEDILPPALRRHEI